jgi:tetratricopeptide (TPR) repeat protein
MRGRAASDRYDLEVADADAQIARLLSALGERRARTLVVAASDHGEAFGEHGEIGHSVFTYDTTLRVPLLIQGPGVPAGRVVTDAVSLVDVAPTMASLAGLGAFDADGRDLSPAFGGAALAARPIYAESFAPLLDFGWSPLRTVRQRDVASAEAARIASMRALVERVGGPALDAGAAPALPDRLAALGYVSGSPAARHRNGSGARPDPKDKIAVASAIARITSGDASGAALEPALRTVLAEDPANPQMNLRLAYVLAESGRCPEARERFALVIRAKAPTADAHLGLASCQAAARQFDSALATLGEAARHEPGNPEVTANIGLVLADAGRPAEAIAPLRQALASAPDLHQARFGLAIALARAGRRDEAAAAARDLLQRLPPDAPQRADVQRLLVTLSSQR